MHRYGHKRYTELPGSSLSIHVLSVLAPASYPPRMDLPLGGPGAQTTSGCGPTAAWREYLAGCRCVRPHAKTQKVGARQNVMGGKNRRAVLSSITAICTGHVCAAQGGISGG
jgi:hypothetical protein